MIERDDTDGVAVVRLARGKVNALDLELVRAISQTFTGLADDPARAVVFTGSGRAFSAGVDLTRVVDGGEAYAREFLPALCEAFLAVYRLGKPVIAAVNGHAIAGGAILVSACDQRLMSAGRIGVTELLVGVAFPVAAVEILRYAVPPVSARTAIFTGATYDPAGAARIGLVDEVVPEAELIDRALAAAHGLADTIPADAYAHTKAHLHRETEERIARWAPDGDAEAVRIWAAGATDGRIARFMADVVGRGR